MPPSSANQRPANATSTSSSANLTPCKRKAEDGDRIGNAVEGRAQQEAAVAVAVAATAATATRGRARDDALKKTTSAKKKARIAVGEGPKASAAAAAAAAGNGRTAALFPTSSSSSSSNKILSRVVHSSQEYLAEIGAGSGGQAEEEATVPNPPPAAASLSVAPAGGALFNLAPAEEAVEEEEEEEDRKMPAVADPHTTRNNHRRNVGGVGGGDQVIEQQQHQEQHQQQQHLAYNRSLLSSSLQQRRRQSSSAASLRSSFCSLSPSDQEKLGLEPMGDVDAVDCLFRKGAILAGVSWIGLVMATYACRFDDPINNPQMADYDDSMDRNVAQTAFFILLVSTMVQVVPLILYRFKSVGTLSASTTISEVLVSAMLILSISLSTNALLGWGPKAVVLDPFTGSPVFLIRWCEWVPLAGFMTLLAESADLPVGDDSWKYPVFFALCQALSTLCGMIFPFCQNWTQWIANMFISCVLFVQIFPRVTKRRRQLLNTPRGSTVLEREHYDRRRFAFYLIAMCCITWTTLVVLYFVNMVVHVFAPPDHWLRFKALTMSCDTIADVIAKVVYTRIIVDAHQAVFASDLRTVRQLNELKQLMSMLWVSSSDVIVISTKQTKHRNATMFSPSYLQLVGANPPLQTCLNPQDSNTQGPGAVGGGDSDKQAAVALVLETDNGKVKSAYYVNTFDVSDDPTRPHQFPSQHMMLAREDLQHNAVIQALRITNTAWTTHSYACRGSGGGGGGGGGGTGSGSGDKNHHPAEPLRALSVVHCDPNRVGKVMCEMKVSQHSEQTAVGVVRDVTERYRRFEAESRAHAETIARQRDMHTANRFTRHEVKNGLLSGIELCRTLGESLQELKSMLQNNDGSLNQGVLNKLQGTMKQNASNLNLKSIKSLVDLDGTLRGVLDTVLAEVMAREVVHEVYQPRLEELDIPSMLITNLGMSKDRIPVTVRGGSMPKLLLDAQLIGHIHRNAVSNACKYGKPGGKVQTYVEFDNNKKEFRMEVTNEPGEGHETLLALGESASEFVFAQGVRLQPHMKGGTEKKLDSSGDGAWIMQKCAKTMNGACNIVFTKNMTRFTLHCPALPVAESSQPNYKEFVVPDNVWGIGVDDSKIQRKLLSRILSHAGVHPSKQILLGETHEDITEFESTLLNLMQEHPDMKFLVIVDEHLDYDNITKQQQDGVHSGSLIMKHILDHMPQEHLSRLLVLMRSANDSAVDIAIYTRRTHGYFPKAIMQRDRTREILAPFWLSRFPEDAP